MGFIVDQKEVALTSVFNPKWYVEQMKGWTFSSYMLLMFGIGIIIGTTIVAPLTLWTILPMVAGVLGFTTTLSITNVRPLNGVFGLISAIIYIIVAAKAKNFADVVLQLSYIVLLDIPVLVMPSWAKNVGQRVRKLNLRNWGLVAIFFVIVYAVLYLMDTRLFISPRPMLDAFAGTIGITGSLLATLRFSDQYYFWIFQGVMSVILWGVTAMQGDANLTLFFTYILYLANDGISLLDKGVAWFHKDTYLKNQHS
ncbi:nicotinamide mononucleotide transporter [Lacticaseibacillus brantae DSM 23927]|uniref:Nicotinamide mononucleotide transporter n=2 Tax=Lacticaseibacillus brantae TaxID=943673 RepID=A0A0R2B859_9LACO|nr:nicotinamide mononucleotide transporter [Lacticaseibacillus brantae DSM 23927]